MNDEKNAVKKILLLISFLLGNKIIREEVNSVRYENIIQKLRLYFFKSIFFDQTYKYIF